MSPTERLARLVLGSADLQDDGLTPLLLERFHATGGRSLDLANHYGSGEASRGVGRWLARSGTREEFTLYVKGCHPPLCSPSLVGKEVDRARSLLGLDVLDVFMLHRDDPAVPVAAFADALREQVERGTIERIGVSNWTPSRFEALAAELGGEAPRLVALSNHFSLATMVTPAWPGCLGMSADDMAALGERGVTALAWAALAHGYLAGRAVASWNSRENEERRERAARLADELGTTLPAVALAYVLHQPGKVWAVAGSRSERHVDELVSATSLELSAEQLAWLEGQAPSSAA